MFFRYVALSSGEKKLHGNLEDSRVNDVKYYIEMCILGYETCGEIHVIFHEVIENIIRYQSSLKFQLTDRDILQYTIFVGIFIFFFLSKGNVTKYTRTI
jgi:hypothetical protein